MADEAMATGAAQRLYGTIFSRLKQQRPQAIKVALEELAEGFGSRTVTEGMARLYTACLDDLSLNECVNAFARAAMESQFFPTPAYLREVAGRNESGDQVGNDAKNFLRAVLAALREFPKLESRKGPLLRTADETGRTLPEPEYGPRIQPPTFPDRVYRAIEYLGYGSREAGVMVLKQHPALKTDVAEDVRFSVNRLKAADEFDARWVEAYRQCAS